MRGQSLFEVVIAVGLSAMILTAAASLSLKSVRNSSYSNNNAQATKYAQEVTEWIRGQRDANTWTAFSAYSSSGGITYCFNSSPPSGWTDPAPCQIANTVFSRSATLTTDAMDANIINILVGVSWVDGQGTHQVLSRAKLTNWR